MAVPESRTTQGQIVGGSNIFQPSREKNKMLKSGSRI